MASTGALNALLTANAPASLALGGLLIGVIFGLVVQRTHFCTMGSISDLLNFGDFRRFRAWLLASAVAVMGARALASLGAVDLSQSAYLSSSLDWFGASLGGALFGFGMVFAGGCASRNLVRIGTGDLRSLVVILVIGVTAYATIGGVLGPLRAAMTSATAVSMASWGLPNQGLGALLARLAGLSPQASDVVGSGLLAGGLLVYCFSNREFRTSPVHVVSGLLVGLLVVAGWALTGLTADDMAEVARAPGSLSFVRPSGDAIEWIERYTAGPIPSFGVSSLFGVVLGAFLGGASSGNLRLATFSDASDTLRNLFGAVLMGIGGVLALGCTLGQAVTGVSTLAMGSMLAFVAIVAGGVAGVKTMERWL